MMTVAPLVRGLLEQHAQSPAVAAACLACLRYLGGHTDNKVALLWAVPLATAAASTHAGCPEVVEAALGVLQTLAHHPDNKRCMLGCAPVAIDRGDSRPGWPSRQQTDSNESTASFRNDFCA
jgi:hypothetical protein